MTVSNVIKCVLCCLYLSETLSKAMAHSLLSFYIHLTPVTCVILDYVLGRRVRSSMV